MTRNMIVLLAVAATIVLAARPTEACKSGIDTTAAVSQSAFSCLIGQGYTFFIGRIQTNTGAFDNVGVQNIANARAAGLPNLVDAYIEPCQDLSVCYPARRQAYGSIENMNLNAGATIGRVWIRVMAVDNWPADTAANQQFLNNMIKGVILMSPKVGVLTSQVDWNTIMGAGFVPTAPTDGSENLLWWSNTTNGDKQYLGLQLNEIGGWRMPFMHQYQVGASVPCGVGTANVNYNEN